MGYSIISDDDVLQIRATIGSQAEMEILISAMRLRMLELPPEVTDERRDTESIRAIPDTAQPNTVDERPRDIGADYITPAEVWKKAPDPIRADHPPAQDSHQES